LDKKMNKLILLSLILAGCASSPINERERCEQRAWESAGNAMSNTQYSLEEKLGWDMLTNCTIGLGCNMTPVTHGYDTGFANGPGSMTNYKGLSSREAFNKSMKECE
jgi:hypothetical protein